MGDEVEIVARTLAGDEWDAKNFCETLDGSDPADAREYWRGVARAAIEALDKHRAIPIVGEAE